MTARPVELPGFVMRRPSQPAEVPDGHRLRLERHLMAGGDGRTLGWVMLNPSTADDNTDDPTIRRCLGFTQAAGYTRMVVRNLFTVRATDPSHLSTIAAAERNDWRNHDPVGALYGDDRVHRVVVAWGARGDLFPDRVRAVVDGWPLRSLFCLGWTKSGQPRHPLYLPTTTRLREWRPGDGRGAGL